jgi:hypothetical protein
MTISNDAKENLKSALMLRDSYFKKADSSIPDKFTLDNQECGWCIHFKYIHDSCGTNIHGNEGGCKCENETPISVCTISYDIDGPLLGAINLCAATSGGCENFELNPSIPKINSIEKIGIVI